MTAQIFDGKQRVYGCREINQHRRWCKARIIGNYCLRLRVYVRRDPRQYVISARIVGHCRNAGHYDSALN